jgi:hypothetical protein
MPPPPRVGKKKKKGPEASAKLPTGITVAASRSDPHHEVPLASAEALKSEGLPAHGAGTHRNIPSQTAGKDEEELG